MDSAPPLNLSTSIKVKDSLSTPESDVSLPVKSELMQHPDSNQFVLLEHMPNEVEGVVITGEINENSQTEKTPDLTKKEEATNGNESSESYVCSHCSEKFLRANQLRSHEKTHVEEKVHTCDQCLETFPRLSLLLRHKQEHTKRTYECPDCDVPLTSYASFRQHMKTHKGEKKFKCSDCSMTFIQQSHLITHKRKHTGEKPFSCHHCNTKFKQRSHLETKPYSCEYCKASFLQITTLKRHVNIHSGYKPFSCDLCQATFFERSSLKRHIQRHDPVKPYCCNHCGSTFQNASSLRRHKFVVHNDVRYENETAKSTLVVKCKDPLEPVATVEEENSLHICEPPYQRSATTSEQNIMVEGNDQNLNREIPQAISQVVKSKAKELLEPIRTSIRLKEAAEKRKYKPKDPDFITATSSGVEESQVLNNGTPESSVINGQFIGPETVVPSQDVNSHIGSNEAKAVYGNAQIISGQVLPNGHFVTQDGAFFIEASDLINSGAGTVVVNAAPGTIFFDIAADGQLLNVPINASVGHESVLVAGSSCLDANLHSAEVEPIYVTSTDHSVANTLSLSVRDSQTNAFLTSSVPSSSTIITNSDLLNSVQSSTVGSSGTVNNLPAGTVPYVQIENSDIGIINPNISFEQGTSVTANQNSFVKTKEPLSKIRSVIVNISKCSVCGKEFASKNTLKQHIKSNHPGLHFCTVCFDAFTTKDHLNTHKLQQHKSSNSCPECNRYFTTKHALNQHRLKEHNS
ncbi:Zinc finger protein 84 [Armadillidium nasatum]|uniref:Zinc finger protein 84 n=1 Tax=Armadillidium nasatum TaxID=96803 RepID=A0A5N5SJP2_9CRUS|nr:Zinc finger protein 84 [Armadillidium nasatum]